MLRRHSKPGDVFVIGNEQISGYTGQKNNSGTPGGLHLFSIALDPLIELLRVADWKISI